MCATEEANGHGSRNGAHPEDLDTVALDGDVEDDEPTKEESRAEVWVREVLLGNGHAPDGTGPVQPYPAP